MHNALDIPRGVVLAFLITGISPHNLVGHVYPYTFIVDRVSLPITSIAPLFEAVDTYLVVYEAFDYI